MIMLLALPFLGVLALTPTTEGSETLKVQFDGDFSLQNRDS